jgi:hypothetical protein
MHNDAPLIFPVPDKRAPFYGILAEKISTPTADHIVYALNDPLISSSQIHTFCTECPGSQTDMGRYTLVALWAMSNPENHYFIFRHATLSAV